MLLFQTRHLPFLLVCCCVCICILVCVCLYRAAATAKTNTGENNQRGFTNNTTSNTLQTTTTTTNSTDPLHDDDNDSTDPFSLDDNDSTEMPPSYVPPTSQPVVPIATAVMPSSSPPYSEYTAADLAPPPDALLDHTNARNIVYLKAHQDWLLQQFSSAQTEVSDLKAQVQAMASAQQEYTSNLTNR